MKNIFLIIHLLSSIILKAEYNTAANTTKYFEQFSTGVYEFTSTGNFSKIEEMFGDSGVYGADCVSYFISSKVGEMREIYDSCNTYDIQLTAIELKERFSEILKDKISDLTIIRNTHQDYTVETFTHGTFFKFEILYNETGRIDDFLVYVDYNGNILTVVTNTNINIKGYLDARTGEFRGNRPD
jgi:hypothetical protein